MTRYRAATSGHHYHLWVRGQGEPLLMLHGFSGDSSSWEEVARRLPGRFQLLALDILGHGQSDSPPNAASYRMEAVAADIIDLLDESTSVPAHLLGYSMGGRLALFLALRYRNRFRSLTLESASPGLSDEGSRAERRRQDEKLASAIESKGIERFVDYWERLPLWESQTRLSKETLAAQRRQRLRNNPLGLANSLRGLGAGAQPPLWTELSGLNLPTLLCVGELDLKFRRINEAMAALIPAAQLTTVAAAGHNVHLEDPDAFCRALQSFYQSL